MDEARNDQNDLIIGRNAVFEAIKSGREIDRLFVQRGEQNPAVKRLISMAREKAQSLKRLTQKARFYVRRRSAPGRGSFGGGA